MILKFDEFVSLNESFKSPTISKLFKDGEFDADIDKSILNQISENDIIGMADSKDDAEDMLNNSGVKTIDTRPRYRRRGDDLEIDYTKPWRIIDMTEDYIIGLKSGKYLVCRVNKKDAHRHLYNIRNDREKRKTVEPTKFEKKFNHRKEFVKNHKKNIEDFNDIKNFFDEKGLLDDFIDECCDELDRCIEIFIDERNVYDIDETYESSIEFKFNDYKIELYPTFKFKYHTSRYYAGFKGDYYQPSEPAITTYEDAYPQLIETGIVIHDTDDKSLMDCTYKPEFDKAHVIDFSDSTYEIEI